VTDVRTGERLPAFSVQLEPPPEGNEHLATRLARLSAEQYGRDVLDAELDLQSALERIRGPQTAAQAEKSDESTKRPEPAAPDTGTPAAGASIVGAELANGESAPAPALGT